MCVVGGYVLKEIGERVVVRELWEIKLFSLFIVFSRFGELFIWLGVGIVKISCFR